MARTHSRILLVIFFLSVSIIPMIEMGHDILHRFKNPFHYHDGGHQLYAVHSTADHFGFQKMKFAHQMEDNQPMHNLVWFAYQFSKSLESFASAPHEAVTLNHYTIITESPYAVHASPPTRPPLAIEVTHLR